MTSRTQTKVKGMCIATRCTSIDQFVEMFHRFVDEDSFFVSTANTRPPGLETSFSVQLADGTPVLRGLCVVLQAWTAPNSPFKTPGVRLGIKRLTASSMPIFERLLVTRSKPPVTPTPVPPPPSAKPKAHGTPTDVMPALPKVIITAQETRTPGSDYVLPANPLMNLTDESLEGYVDCTLYEETANYFPADDDGSPMDELAPPPAPVAAARAPEPPTFAPRPVANNPAPIELVAEEPPADAEEPPPITIHSIAEPLPLEPSIVEALPIAPPPVPPPRPIIPITRESLPAGELAAMPIAKPRRRRWPVVAGAAVLAAATIVSISALGSRPEHAVVSSKPVVTAPAEPAIIADPAPAAAPQPAVDRPVVDQPAPSVDKPAVAAPEPTDDVAEPANGEPPTGESERPTAGEGPCRINVASTPAGSIVYLDGTRMAPSPITLATACGRHKVEIKHPRYQLATRMVTATESTPGTFEITMQRPTHSVSFTSQPSGATVFIDGRRAGTTPTNVSVLGFSNLKIEIKKTGYAPVSTYLYSKVPQDKFSQRLTKW